MLEGFSFHCAYSEKHEMQQKCRWVSGKKGGLVAAAAVAEGSARSCACGVRALVPWRALVTSHCYPAWCWAPPASFAKGTAMPLTMLHPATCSFVLLTA